MDSMNITSAQYFESEGSKVSIKLIIDSIEMNVPLDSSNRHYQAIQEWVAEGNTIAEAE